MSENSIKVNFELFISGLIVEGMVSLGLIKNPLTNEIKKDRKHAAYIIDVLEVLKEKTEGNLAEDEKDVFDRGLHQLRMAYVQLNENNGKGEVEKNDDLNKGSE